jgi:hypothetical protein
MAPLRPQISSTAGWLPPHNAHMGSCLFMLIPNQEVGHVFKSGSHELRTSRMTLGHPETATMHINRIKGAAIDGFEFDGRFVHPADPMGRSAYYDSGTRELGLSWRSSENWFDRHDHLVRARDNKVAWIVDQGILVPRLLPNAPRWVFDGRLLRPCVDWKNDEWLSTEEAPILVMMLAARLI